MDKIDKKGACKQADSSSDLFLRWGNKKRLRCVKVGDADDTAGPSSPVSGRRRARRNINSNFVTFSSDNDSGEPSLHLPSTRLTRTSEAATNLQSESNRKSSSEKEHKLYTAAGVVEKKKISSAGGGGGVVDESGGKSNHVWPKLYIALTSKEKEEDFMAMKGYKPSHRPKKRAKMIQRTILLVSPGAWLSDMCQERYEVIEKKNTKKATHTIVCGVFVTHITRRLRLLTPTIMAMQTDGIPPQRVGMTLLTGRRSIYRRTCHNRIPGLLSRPDLLRGDDEDRII